MIKITPTNASPIIALLTQANGRAEAHAYTTFTEIADLAEQAEREVLALVGGKAHAVGARYTATSGSRVAKAYKYRRNGTCVTLLRRPAGWFIVDAASVALYQQAGTSRVTLTPAQDGIAVARLRATYSIHKED